MKAIDTPGFKRPFTTFFVSASALLLAACGDGGGTQPVTVFPVDSVVTRLATSGGPFSGNYVDSAGVPYKLNVSYIPRDKGLFFRKETLITNGVSGVPTQTSVGFTHADSLFKVVSWTSNTGDTANILKSSALPFSANVGTGGNLFSGTLFIQNNGLNTSDIGLTRRLSYDWALTAVSDITADLCLNFAETADFFTLTKLDCFRVDSAGTILAFKSTFRVHAKSIDSEIVYQ